MGHSFITKNQSGQWSPIWELQRCQTVLYRSTDHRLRLITASHHVSSEARSCYIIFRVSRNRKLFFYLYNMITTLGCYVRCDGTDLFTRKQRKYKIAKESK